MVADALTKAFIAKRKTRSLYSSSMYKKRVDATSTIHAHQGRVLRTDGALSWCLLQYLAGLSEAST